MLVFRQLFDPASSTYTYLLADGRSSAAVIIDPVFEQVRRDAALIEAVAELARERGCATLYWTTKEDNTAARSLYDRIARFNGFIRYDYALE